MAKKIGPIPSFLNKISNNWGLSFIFTKIWGITFHPSRGLNSLASSIQNVLTKYDDINDFLSFINSDGNIYRNILGNNEAISNRIAEIESFILANKISIPNENVSISFPASVQIPNAGGLIQGRVGEGRRSNFNDLSITFLDTNRELVEYIIKPWIIAVAHQGLIEDPQLDNLKADIKCYFFAKSSPNFQVKRNGERLVQTSFYPQYTNSQNLTTQPYVRGSKSTEYMVSKANEEQPYLRKIITFRGCVPLSIPDKSYNYAGDMGADEMMTPIKFSYEWYEVQEMAGKPFSLGDALVTEGKTTTLPTIYDNSIDPETSLRGGNIV